MKGIPSGDGDRQAHLFDAVDENNTVWAISMDFGNVCQHTMFCLFNDLILASQLYRIKNLKFGIVVMTCLSLPPECRFWDEYIIEIGVIPCPLREARILPFLDYYVRGFQALWTGVVAFFGVVLCLTCV